MAHRPIDRLARNSSTSSSAHSRQRSSIDPFVSRQHAEVAAVEAYNRALNHRHFGDTCRTERRRCEREGSHFESARLGRRSSGKKTSIKEKPSRNRLQKRIAPSMPQLRTQPCPSIFTARPLGSPPSEALSSPLTTAPAKRVRKVVSMTGEDGSPAPRHKDGYGGNLAILSEFARHLETPTNPAHAATEGLCQLQRQNQEALAKARDEELQAFQQQSKLRGRKSLIFASFRKQSFTSFVKKDRGTGLDTSTPPFNLANEVDPPLSAPTLRVETPAPPIQRLASKSRNFSDTIKDRFKKVLRKSSRPPSGLPPQHIEARNHHYRLGANDPNIHRFSVRSPYPQPPLPPASPRADASPGPYRLNKQSASKVSIDEASLAKSRVTSWTNSTFTGTQSTRKPSGQPSATSEFGALRRSDSVSTLKRTGSLINRSVGDPIRRASKRALGSSEESQGLYTALKERIRPRHSVFDPADHHEGSKTVVEQKEAIEKSVGDGESLANANVAQVNERHRSALSDLPSQQRKASTTSLRRCGFMPTLQSQSQSQEQSAETRNVLSPVTELRSPSSHAHGMWKIGQRPASPALTVTEAGTGISEKLSRSAVINDRVRSPTSVYSRPEDEVNIRPATPADCGAMVTITGREVRRYSISPEKADSRPPPQPSGEWRRWISNEMQGLNSVQFASQSDQAAEVDNCLSDATSRPPSRIHKATSRESSRQREVSSSRAATRRSSFMNERYPMLQSELQPNGGQTLSRSSYVQQLDTNELPSELQRRSPQLTLRASEMPTASTNDSVIEAYSRLSTAPQATIAPNQTRPRSALDLKARYKTDISSASKPLVINRHRSHNILEDRTIRKISEGPYARPSSSTSGALEHPVGANRENANPQKFSVPNVNSKFIAATTEGNENPPNENLPSLSSAEWLAPGPRKIDESVSLRSREEASSSFKSTPIGIRRQRQMATVTTSTRRSSGHAGEIKPTESPAQKMVTEWLGGKNREDGSPAFV